MESFELEKIKIENRKTETYIDGYTDLNGTQFVAEDIRKYNTLLYSSLLIVFIAIIKMPFSETMQDVLTELEYIQQRKLHRILKAT